MPELNIGPRDEISFLSLGTALLRRRWRIARWTGIGAVLAAIVVFSRPALYVASASFVTQGQTDASRSGLASLAGQFGVSLPGGNQSLSPDFYAQLLKSRELLQSIVIDTLTVQELGNKRVLFLDLFDIRGDTQKRREEQGVRALNRLVSAAVNRTTGVVEFSVATRWPSVSMAIAQALVEAVNDFNRRTRQEQAGAERKFIEGRLSLAGADLRASEDRLEQFLKSNRQFASSPDLTFERDRLQRDVTLKQQVFTSLTQSYEEVRIREVRDTPVITLVESPAVPTLPEPRRRLFGLLVGILLGALVGSVSALASEGMARRRNAGSPEAVEFAGTIADIKREIRRTVPWVRRGVRG